MHHLLKHLCFLMVLFLTSSYVSAQQRLIWHKEKAAPGIRHWSVHTNQLFDSQQNINLLAVRKKREIAIGFEPDSLKETSAFAKEYHALAAVNAGFFDVKNGGSVTYLKVDNHAISPTRNKKSENAEGAFVINKKGKIIIEPAKGEQFYDTNEDYFSVLVTGPLLLLQGKKEPLQDNAFSNNRHPRTCACLQKNGRLLFLTIDGRAEPAQGMSLPELQDFLLQLKCKDAINFDGGGSTTMWLANEPENGVVNMPSDNKLFDRYGERRVANVILIKK